MPVLCVNRCACTCVPMRAFRAPCSTRTPLLSLMIQGRGEPRGSRKKGSDYKHQGLGDCIDCTMCVQVCPTGIDIRNGLQANCIACAACIDVCDTVMDKVGYDRGLIRYTTENAVSGKVTHILRPRVFVYAGLLIGISLAVVWGIATRVPLELDVIRDRNTLYRETLEGKIENVYTLKVINMDHVGHDYQLTVDGIEDVELKMTRETIHASAGEVIELPLWLRVDPADLKSRSTAITFTMQAKDSDKLKVVEEARFLGPTGVGR